MEVLNDDCLEHVFMYLDVETLTNVVVTNQDRYLVSAKIVFSRKFRKEFTIFDSSSACMIVNYISRLEYFGDLITKLRIHFPSSQIHQIFKAIADKCKQSLTEFEFHCADASSIDQNALQALRSFIQHLGMNFSHLRVLKCKYGDDGAQPGSFDYLNIIIPEIPSLNKLTIDGFGGKLDENSKKSICSNPQIEELALFAGYENLRSSYLTLIADKLPYLKFLDLRFAVFFDLDGSLTPLNFECLKTLKVLCCFNLSGNVLPFSDSLMNNLEHLDYICATTNDQMINIVSQFKQLKKLKVGAYGLTDKHLMILAQNLEKIEFLEVMDLPSDEATAFLLTSKGIQEFLNERNDLQFIMSISIRENHTHVNEQLVLKIKQILNNTEWIVLEKQFSSGDRYVVIFNS